MPGRRKTANRLSMSKKQLAALVEEATVDCYNESEAVCGFYTMIEDHLEVPFATVVLGVDVEVDACRVDAAGGDRCRLCARQAAPADPGLRSAPAVATAGGCGVDRSLPLLGCRRVKEENRERVSVLRVSGD